MAAGSSAIPNEPFSGVDASVPHSARMWNYWLGGKDNDAIDRELGEQIYHAYPPPDRENGPRWARIPDSGGAAPHSGSGIRQFLDIGTGLPSADNTHEVAQRIASGTQVVYVDNDPLVLAHARTLLTSDPADTTRYIDADLREPHDIVEKAGNVLDLSQPTAVLLMGILGHIRSTAQARETIDTILSAVPSGSYLAIYDGSNIDPGAVEAERQYNETAPLPYYLRDRADFGALFEGLEPVPPGIVTCSRWCAEHDGSASTTHAPILGAVARKP